MKDSFIAVYGTLREGLGNFNRLGNQEFVERKSIPGKIMASKWLPFADNSDDAKNEIIMELHRVDEATLNRISRMELGAGYREENMEWELDNGETVRATWWPHDATKGLVEGGSGLVDYAKERGSY